MADEFRPPWEEDFMQATASHMMNVSGQLGAMMQQSMAGGGNRSAMDAFMAPPKVTKSMKRQIAALPQCSGRSATDVPIWMVHVSEDHEDDGIGLTCTVWQVKKEISNGEILGNDDGTGLNLAMCGIFDTSRSTTSRPPLLLGTIAKACLKPGGLTMMPGMISNHLRPSRPRKILFPNRAELELLRDDLEKMGIHELDVAHSSLLKSLELYSSSINNMNSAEYGALNAMIHTGDMSDPQTMAQMAGRRINAHTEAMFDPYVSEESMPFRGWKPPRGKGSLPRSWYIRPPEDINSWKQTELLGWRTNLERAVLRADVDRIKAIVDSHDAKDVREFVECRMLLTKMATRGMVDACEALIDLCGASVEGAQAPDAESWWLDVQNESGNYESLTPLHQASRNGRAEAVKLLLKRGAEVNRIDKAPIRGSALHHAVSMGQLDCVRILCENGADLTYEGMGGEALDISDMCAGQDAAHRKVQDKVQEILREFDTRCSHCRAPKPAKYCPCGKERYCSIECQRGRWKGHKKYHKSIVGDKKK